MIEKYFFKDKRPFITNPLANQTVTMYELSNEDFIYRERGSSTLDLLESIFYTFNAPLPKLGLQMQGLHESIKVVESGYGMTLAPSYSVSESITSGKLAQVYIEQANIQQSLFICSRKSDLIEQPFIQFLKII